MSPISPHAHAPGPVDPIPRPIRIFGDVYFAARARKLAVDCETWHMLRYLDARGVGWIDRQSALVGLQQIFGLSLSTAYRRLHYRQNNPFWQSAGARLYLRGIAPVARMLGLARLERPAEVPLEAYRGIVGRRSSALKAWFAARAVHGRTNPVSQKIIAQETGVAPSTQRRYRARGITVIRNVGVADHDPYPDQPGRTRYDPRRRRYLFRLPNSYAVPEATPAGRSTVKKINRHKLSSWGGHRGGTRKTYLRTPARAARPATGPRFVLAPDQSRPNQQRWCYHPPDFDRWWPAAPSPAAHCGGAP